MSEHIFQERIKTTGTLACYLRQNFQDAPLARKTFLLHESEAAALIAVSGAGTGM